MARKQAFVVLGMFVFTSVFSGCAYLKNRGNDTLDMFDLGITVSKKPGFALYMDKPPVMPMGYANVDGKLIGLGRSRFGVHDFREKAVGYLIGGSIQRGLDNYDPQDPNALKEYGAGLIGYLNGTTAFQNDPAIGETGRPKTRPTCPLTIHLGWVGFEWGCKFWDMLDFVLGWTTFDIGHDDLFVSGQQKSETKETEEQAATAPEEAPQEK
jgi:hypothetical protein